MEIARLVLEYLQALAWPGITITAILIFRKQLRQLLANIGSAVHRVKKFTAPGTTIELINELSQKVELIDLTPSKDDVVPNPKTKSTPKTKPRLREYATTETTTSGAPTRDTPTPDTPTGDAPTPTTGVPGDAPTPTTEVPGDAPTPTTEVPGDAPTPTTEVPGDAPTPTRRVPGDPPRDTEPEDIGLDDLTRGKIVRIWNEIDASLFKLAAVEAPWYVGSSGGRNVSRQHPNANVELLKARGLITENYAELLIAARRIRNQVIHEFDIIPMGAFDEYLRTISKLNEYLKNLCEVI